MPNTPKRRKPSRRSESVRRSHGGETRVNVRVNVSISEDSTSATPNSDEQSEMSTENSSESLDRSSTSSFDSAACSHTCSCCATVFLDDSPPESEASEATLERSDYQWLEDAEDPSFYIPYDSSERTTHSTCSCCSRITTGYTENTPSRQSSVCCESLPSDFSTYSGLKEEKASKYSQTEAILPLKRVKLDDSKSTFEHSELSADAKSQQSESDRSSGTSPPNSEVSAEKSSVSATASDSGSKKPFCALQEPINVTSELSLQVTPQGDVALCTRFLLFSEKANPEENVEMHTVHPMLRHTTPLGKKESDAAENLFRVKVGNDRVAVERITSLSGFSEAGGDFSFSDRRKITEICALSWHPKDKKNRVASVGELGVECRYRITAAADGTLSATESLFVGFAEESRQARWKSLEAFVASSAYPSASVTQTFFYDEMVMLGAAPAGVTAVRRVDILKGKASPSGFGLLEKRVYTNDEDTATEGEFPDESSTTVSPSSQTTGTSPGTQESKSETSSKK